MAEKIKMLKMLKTSTISKMSAAQLNFNILSSSFFFKHP